MSDSYCVCKGDASLSAVRVFGDFDSRKIVSFSENGGGYSKQNGGHFVHVVVSG